MLAAIGRHVRVRILFVLELLGLSARLLAALPRPSSWPPPVTAEFFRRLRQALLGGLPATVVLGLLVGAGLVFQGIALAAAAAQEALFADVLARVLVREVAPILIGLLLLGRSGLVVAAELSALRQLGASRHLLLAGVDPKRLLVLPATVALALAGLTLGILFVGAALLSGGALAWLLGGGRVALFDQLNDTLRAMRPQDVLLFPLKLLLCGGLVGVIAAASPLAAEEPRPAAVLLPEAFVRGVLAVVLVSVLLGLAA
jgi:phospholipid/cholesterol/gamma-HCH transport system permease protein